MRVLSIRVIHARIFAYVTRERERDDTDFSGVCAAHSPAPGPVICVPLSEPVVLSPAFGDIPISIYNNVCIYTRAAWIPPWLLTLASSWRRRNLRREPR